MYYGQVARTIIGYCIYCDSVVYVDEEGETIYTGDKSCNCTVSRNRTEDIEEQDEQDD